MSDFAMLRGHFQILQEPARFIERFRYLSKPLDSAAGRKVRGDAVHGRVIAWFKRC